MEEKFVLDQTLITSGSEKLSQSKENKKKYLEASSDSKNTSFLFSKEDAKYYKIKQAKVERIVFKIR